MTKKELQKIRDSIEDHSIYITSRYKAWRKRIYKRDGYQCQFPGCKCKYNTLNAHHIQMKWYFPELMYKARNGITLCKKHHSYIHRRGSDKYIDKFLEIAKDNGTKGRIIRKKVIKPRKKKRKK